VINILHGKGDQLWMTKSFEEDRLKALDDRTLFTDAELTTLELTESQGQGKYDVDTWSIKQYPFPLETSIRKRIKIDIRKAKPKIGGAD